MEVKSYALSKGTTLKNFQIWERTLQNMKQKTTMTWNFLETFKLTKIINFHWISFLLGIYSVNVS